MPWNRQDFPDAMKNLDSRVRAKAIEIANRLVEEHVEEGRAIAIAISQARHWAGENGGSEPFDADDQHVLPHEKGWAVKREGASQASQTFDLKEEALDRARELANNQGARVVVHRQDGTIEDVFRPKKRSPG